jgi:hypothetical protein
MNEEVFLKMQRVLSKKVNLKDDFKESRGM